MENVCVKKIRKVVLIIPYGIEINIILLIVSNFLVLIIPYGIEMHED